MKLTDAELTLLESICEKHQIQKEHLLTLIETEIEYSLKASARRHGFFNELVGQLDEWVKAGE